MFLKWQNILLKGNSRQISRNAKKGGGSRARMTEWEREGSVYVYVCVRDMESNLLNCPFSDALLWLLISISGQWNLMNILTMWDPYAEADL